MLKRALRIDAEDSAALCALRRVNELEGKFDVASAAHVGTGAIDHRRSCRLYDFAALGAVDGIAWSGLHKGHDEGRRSCDSLQLDPLGAGIGDFSDTAAILTHLDIMMAENARDVDGYMPTKAAINARTSRIVASGA